MTKLTVSALGVLLLISSACVCAASVPTHIQIKYRVSMGSMKIGEGLDTFQHDGKTYSVVSESKTAGVAAMLYRLNIRREAKGRITSDGLKPRTFVESRNDKVKRSATFDWETNQVELSDGDENKQTVPLPPSTWDATSFAWNFAFVPPGDKELNINLTDGRRVTSYRYAIVGRETLNTVVGDMATLHVKKVQEGDDKRAFDVWLATERNYVPVRIRYTEKDGTAFDSLVEAITTSPR
jgi:Protein of unknown function (DUF3108)